MHVVQSEYYGDHTRWFIATVTNNIPPLGMEGKVQIAIRGIHSEDMADIDIDDLPWADVLIPSHAAGASGHGLIPRLIPYTTVYGVFLDGELSQQPLILGQIHTHEFKSAIQANKETSDVSPMDSDRAYNNGFRYFTPFTDFIEQFNDINSNYEKASSVYTDDWENRSETDPGRLILSAENDFDEETVLGYAIAYHKWTKNKDKAKGPRNVSLSKEEFSLNYIGAPNRNAEPSFSSSGSSKTASAQNQAMSGVSTENAMMKEATNVDAKKHLKKVLDYLES